MELSGATLRADERATIEALVQRLHRLRLKGDFVSIAAMIDENAVFEFVGRRPFFEFAGVYHGRDEIVSVFKQLNSEVALLDAEILDLVIEGNHVFHRRRMVLQHRGTGLRAEQEVWDVFYFRNGLLAEGRRLLDTLAYERLKND